MHGTRNTFLLGCVAIAIFSAMSPGSAQVEERRVALIIGNSKYRSIADRDLKNPVEDAAAMQVALHRLNFELIIGQDLPFEVFKDKVREFSVAMNSADIGLLFYAGHGVQYKDENYLLPTDIELKSEAEIVARSIALNKIIEDMGKRAKSSIILLDACRDSPQFRTVTRGPTTGSPMASMFGRGLARISSPPGDRFVIYAAAPGTVAEDGRGKNSPFTEALLKHIATPGLEINALFSRVRGDVLRVTQRRQQPEALNRLSQPLWLKASAAPGHPAAEPPPASDESPAGIALSVDTEFWIGIKDTNDLKNFEDYLQLYPKGRFATLAKRRLELLKAATSKLAEPPARPAQKEAAAADGEFEVTGHARITKEHPKLEALRSARALARAKAILKALLSSDTSLPGSVSSSREAADLLGFMGRGLTHGEFWREHTVNASEVRVELRTRVSLLPTGTERKLSGSIEPATVIAKQSFRVKIDAVKDVNIGVFAWQANGTVVRLYPESMTQKLQIKRGQSVSLPRANNSYPAIASDNMPGERSNHEAIIVVTGAPSLSLGSLVIASIAGTPQQSMADSVDGSEFLSALAALHDPELEVLVLPYEVRAAP